MKVINPATEAVIQEFDEDTADSIAKKFAAAKQAQKAWAAQPLSVRKQALSKFKDLVNERKPKLAEILTSEMGKPLAQAKNEIGAVIGRIEFFLAEVDRVIADESVFKDAAQKLEEKISHEPLGVIGNISAWNYPYFVGANVFVPALLTGNAVLYKPSEFTTLTGQAIAEMLYESGVPKDVFALVVGGGTVGAELLKQPLNGIFFTGSYATGCKIAEAAAKQLIKVQLELGGKDPSYITEDVDVKNAAESTADGAFYNTGQSCCSVERIYVHEKVYDQFMEHFMATVKSFKMGDPMEEGTYIGPLTRKSHQEFLEFQIKDAVDKGAKILCGGKRVQGKKGYYFEPTVLVDVNHSMSVMRDETFGPVIGIQKVSNDVEAVTLMNETTFGLTAGVYCRDRARSEKMLAQLNAGSTYWNCCDRVSPRLPWAGRGHSGLGLTLSHYGITTFTQTKGWHLRG